MSLFTIYVHLKNYRKPHLQRFVVRLILIVPIYATSSCIGLFSLPAAFLIDLVRDLYEAFAIYCFFELLVAYLGGERSVLILMIGRRPVPHPWPFNIILREMDMSDPYTFLAIKRGILQYVQIKPALAVSVIVLKTFGRYEEGVLEAGNGYTYVSSVYNISIFLSLYCLAIFWKALASELEPFRPTAKFLTVKGVVFATFWQGWAFSILVASGLVKSIGPISDPSFLTLGLQDLLLTLEMPLFALGHMYAFSHCDYVDSWATHQARLPVTYALRDALGGQDVLKDSLTTIRGTGYAYQTFEPSQGAVHQGLARTRRLHAGLRYTTGGKGKYFLPLRAMHASVPWAEEGTRIQGPFSAVKNWMEERRLRQGGFARMTDEEEAELVHENPDNETQDERNGNDKNRWRAKLAARRIGYGMETRLAFFADSDQLDAHEDESLGFHTPLSTGSEENMYDKARGLEHGDYAFPTIACVPEEKKKKRWREEEEWLLGGYGSGKKDGSTARRERRKHVEGWLDRMRGLVGGQDDLEEAGNAESVHRRPLITSDGNTAEARGSAGKPRKRKAQKLNRTVTSKQASGIQESDEHQSPLNGGSDGADAEQADPDDSVVTRKEANADFPEAGAVDLIVADSSEEQRKRDIERRRGDPALRTRRGEKRVFRRVWTGGSGRVATLQSLLKEHEENLAAHKDPTFSRGHDTTLSRPEPRTAHSVKSAQGMEAVHVERPEESDGDTRDVVMTTRFAEPSGSNDAEGKVAITVEVPGLRPPAEEAGRTRNISRRGPGGEQVGLIDKISEVRPGTEKDHIDERDGKRDYGYAPEPTTHMHIYQRHDWRWHAPGGFDGDEDHNPWA